MWRSGSAINGACVNSLQYLFFKLLHGKPNASRCRQSSSDNLSKFFPLKYTSDNLYPFTGVTPCHLVPSN
eukprot:12906933-Prorocentrum_lima.AAC.1